MTFKSDSTRVARAYGAPAGEPRLSLCCYAHKLRDDGVNYRTIRYATLLKEGPSLSHATKRVAEIVLHNLDVARTTLRYCVAEDIHGLRLSAGMFPLLSHPLLPDLNLDAVIEESPAIAATLADIGGMATSYNIRLSYHAQHYTSLTTLTDDAVLASSRRDLEVLARSLDLMGMPRSPMSPINLHLQGDHFELKAARLNTFYEQFFLLSPGVRDRLVVEQNDRGPWNLQTLIASVHEELCIPVTYDTLHQRTNPGSLTYKEAFLMAYETWPCEPVFHYSDNASGDFSTAHADLPTDLPPVYADLPVLWDVEFKGKERAIQRARDLYRSRTITAYTGRLGRALLVGDAIFPDGMGDTVRPVSAPAGMTWAEKAAWYRGRFPHHPTRATPDVIGANIYDVWNEFMRTRGTTPDTLFLGREEYEVLTEHLVKVAGGAYRDGDLRTFNGMRIVSAPVQSIIRVSDSKRYRRAPLPF